MVDLGGIRKEISLALVDGVQVGDYVILHVGYALSKLDPAEAERTLALFADAPSARRSPRHEVHRRIPRRRPRARSPRAIAAEAAKGGGQRRYNLMEFCGGHTHAISRYGVADLLPPACA
jgi:hydrogenase expression/formation protein HypC